MLSTELTWYKRCITRKSRAPSYTQAPPPNPPFCQEHSLLVLSSVGFLRYSVHSHLSLSYEKLF